MQLLQDQYVCLQEKHADVVAACKLALEKPDMRQGGESIFLGALMAHLLVINQQSLMVFSPQHAGRGSQIYWRG